MNKKFRDNIYFVCMVIMTGSLIGVIILKKYLPNNMDMSVVTIGTFIAIVGEISLILADTIKKYIVQNKIYKMNKLISYNKKRKELEEEIEKLTKELSDSDWGAYLDINRLVFAGQNIENINEIVSYKSFLKQFGLADEKITVRRNSALFLTPFTNEGQRLFNTCRNTLNEMGIFLQRTDNSVEKEDIMMNIILLILQSEIIIANINGRNPNVYYELGIAHALGKTTILLSEAEFDSDAVGFDIRQKRIIMYKSLNDLEKQLLYQINRLNSKKKNDLLEGDCTS